MKQKKKRITFKKAYRVHLFHCSYHQRHMWSLLLCMSFIIPASALAADFQDHSYFKSDEATSSAMQSIWDSGTGNGFRAGVQSVGLTVGTTYGILILGGEERHHLALTSASYGRMFGRTIGRDRWYNGNIEMRAEVFSGAQFNSVTRGIVGLTPHIRYHFATGTRLIPYCDVGAGITMTEIRGLDLGGVFQFNLQAISGANYFIKDNLSLNVAVQYLHISSSGIYKPNNMV